MLYCFVDKLKITLLTAFMLYEEYQRHNLFILGR